MTCRVFNALCVHLRLPVVTEVLNPLDSREQEEASEGLPEFEDTQSPEPQSPQPSEYAWGSEDYSTPNGHNPPGNPLPNTVSSAYEDYGPSPSEPDVPGFREIPEVEQSQDVFDSPAQSAQENRPTST